MGTSTISGMVEELFDFVLYDCNLLNLRKVCLNPMLPIGWTSLTA